MTNSNYRKARRVVNLAIVVGVLVVVSVLLGAFISWTVAAVSFGFTVLFAVISWFCVHHNSTRILSILGSAFGAIALTLIVLMVNGKISFKDLSAVTVQNAKVVQNASVVENADTVNNAKNVKHADTVKKADTVNKAKIVKHADTVEKADTVNEAKVVKHADVVEKADTVNEAKVVKHADTVENSGNSYSETNNGSSYQPKPESKPESRPESKPESKPDPTPVATKITSNIRFADYVDGAEDVFASVVFSGNARSRANITSNHLSNISWQNDHVAYVYMKVKPDYNGRVYVSVTGNGIESNSDSMNY